jgi:hypothetical protein
MDLKSNYREPNDRRGDEAETLSLENSYLEVTFGP